MFTLYDSHTHLADLSLQKDFTFLLKQIDSSLLKGVVIASCAMDEWPVILAFVQRSPKLRGAFGVHPIGLSKIQISTQVFYKKLESAWKQSLLVCHKIIAVGEIGLDYVQKDAVDHQRQIEFFTVQLRFAKDHNLTVILHIRKAWNDFFKVLQNHPDFRSLRIVYHNASCSIEIAKELLKLPALFFSFCGPLTWENAHKIHRLARWVPVERLLIESDTPNLSPACHRLQDSRPWMILEILQKLAELRGCSQECLAVQLEKNWNECFRLFV
ncbi:MAG: TatD family hydrolase [Lentisphaeria bacterium]